MLVCSDGDLQSNTGHSSRLVYIVSRRDNITRYNHVVQELNKEFNRYSKISGRDFFRVIDYEQEIAIRRLFLLYQKKQGVSLTVEI